MHGLFVYKHLTFTHVYTCIKKNTHTCKENLEQTLYHSVFFQPFRKVLRTTLWEKESVVSQRSLLFSMMYSSLEIPVKFRTDLQFFPLKRS